MTDLIIPAESPALNQLKAGRRDLWARRTIFTVLHKLKYGRIRIFEDSQHHIFGGTNQAPPLEATVNVHHPRFYSRRLFNGSMGAAEAYMEGLWSADDLTTVMRIMALNQPVFTEMDLDPGRMIEPGDAVQQARFSRSVGSDDRCDQTRLDGYVHIRKRTQTAKIQCSRLNHQNVLRHIRFISHKSNQPVTSPLLNREAPRDRTAHPPAGAIEKPR